MGWKGTIRSIQAASRKSERESQRRQKELEKRQKQAAKMEEMARAALDVEVYDNYLDVIGSVHKQCSEKFDWNAILKVPAPVEPQNVTLRQDRAAERLARFKPGLFTKLVKGEDKKRQKLQDNLDLAKVEDEREYQALKQQYEADRAEWDASQELATAVIEGDPGAYLEALRQVGPFNDISDLGSMVYFDAHTKEVLAAKVSVNSDEVIPKTVKSLTQAGKLSEKKMPMGRFYELYQDYICGGALRVAREVFALLPIEMVIVSAEGEVLNSATGHMEPQPLLSVAIPRATLETLNFDAIDPSDSMANFVHNMTFQKTKGFKPVEALDPKNFIREN